MWKILLFAIGRKFKAKFTNADSTIGFVLTILYVLFFLFNGVTIGFLMDKLADSDTAKLSVADLIKGINLFFCGFMVLLYFFPSYEYRAKIVSKAYPIGFNQR
ncbi:hypothetical protein [Runella sp.]|jgi:biotin transporter BioY|nr:hypothetical protein [Runella sp.]